MHAIEYKRVLNVNGKNRFLYGWDIIITYIHYNNSNQYNQHF